MKAPRATRQSRPNWALRAMSGLPPVATRQRTCRIGSFVPIAAVSNCRKYITFAGQTYSITLSARNTTDAGTSNPIILAAFKLMTKLNRVGCSTGRSLGLTPRSSLASCRLMMSRYS